MTGRAPLPAALAEDRILPVARRVPLDRLLVVAEALNGAGLRLLEITMDGEGAAEAIARLSGGGRVVGAGTVRSTADAADAVAAGAAFLVCPHTDVAIIRWATSRDIPILPGAYTPTEVAAAWGAGASAVKLFPAAVGGTALLRALAAPFADVPFVPSGGVEAATVGEWLAAGAVAVAVGGWLTGGRDPVEARRRADQLRAAVTAAG